MAQFTIVFSGLMCHVDVDDYTRNAVIVRDSKHEPIIWARNVRANTFKELSEKEGWRRFKIPSDAQIQINGLVKKEIGPLPAAVPSINEFIPHFEPLDEILSAQEHGWVRAYVEYSGGTFLPVTCYYPHAATFNDDDNYVCRARELVFTTEPLESAFEVEIVDLRSRRVLTVPPDSIIAFTQLDRLESAGDHKLYRHLSKTAVGVKEMKIRETPKCESTFCILPEPFYSVDVECTSSHWP